MDWNKPQHRHFIFFSFFSFSRCKFARTRQIDLIYRGLRVTDHLPMKNRRKSNWQCETERIHKQLAKRTRKQHVQSIHVRFSVYRTDRSLKAINNKVITAPIVVAVTNKNILYHLNALLHTHVTHIHRKKKWSHRKRTTFANVFSTLRILASHCYLRCNYCNWVSTWSFFLHAFRLRNTRDSFCVRHLKLPNV